MTIFFFSFYSRGYHGMIFECGSISQSSFHRSAYFMFLDSKDRSHKRTSLLLGMIIKSYPSDGMVSHLANGKWTLYSLYDLIICFAHHCATSGSKMAQNQLELFKSMVKIIFFLVCPPERKGSDEIPLWHFIVPVSSTWFGQRLVVCSLSWLSTNVAGDLTTSLLVHRWITQLKTFQLTFRPWPTLS